MKGFALFFQHRIKNAKHSIDKQLTKSRECNHQWSFQNIVQERSHHLSSCTAAIVLQPWPVLPEASHGTISDACASHLHYPAAQTTLNIYKITSWSLMSNFYFKATTENRTECTKILVYVFIKKSIMVCANSMLTGM